MLEGALQTWEAYRARLALKVRFQLYRQLHRLLSTKRRSLSQALDILYDQWSDNGRKISNRTARVIDGWRGSLQRGQAEIGEDGNYGTLASAMGRSIPRLEAAILSAGNGPHLISSLSGLSRLISVQIEIRRKVGKALLIPKIAMVVLLCIMIVMHHFMLPFLAMTKPVDEWTGLPWALAGIASLSAQIWPLLLAYALLGDAISNFIMERWTGFGRETADKRLPGFRLYRITTGISFLFVLTAFARTSRVDDTKALQNYSEMASPYVRSRLAPVLTYLRNQGGRIGEAMMTVERPWPSVDIARNLATVEPSKENPLHEQLEELAELELSEINEQVEKASAIYQVMAMFGIVLFLIFFMVAMASLIVDQISFIPGIF